MRVDLIAVKSSRKSLKRSGGSDVDGAVLVDMVGLSRVEVARGGMDGGAAGGRRWVVE